MLLKNAAVVFPTYESTSHSILIKDARIAAILSDVEAELIKDQPTIDLTGTKVFAGFIDVHNHGAIGVDVNNAGSLELQKVNEFLAAHGVTAWLPTFVPDSIENYRKCAAAVDEAMQRQESFENSGAEIIGVHYEGPFVNEKMCGALRVQYFKSYQDRNDLRVLPKLANKSAVHLMTVAPEIPGGIELVKELIRQNWIIAIGHTRAEKSILDQAFTHGAQHITHFFNAMTGLHHREIGVVGWAMANEKVSVDIIADGIHVAAPVLKIAHKIKTTEKMLLISDSVSPTGLGDGDFEVWNEKISVVGGQTRNERGSLAGSLITMRDAVKTMLSLGVSAPEVSRMASLNPAKLLGITDSFGSIETGKRADLTALDVSGEVVLTIVGGKIAFQKS